MTARLDAALADAARSDAPETIALMRVLIEAASEVEARHGFQRAIALYDALADVAATARLRRLEALWNSHPRAWSVVRSTIDGIAHNRQDDTPNGTLRYWAEAFDRLAAASPEASVALYSLGDPDLLADVTEEIVERMDAWGLLSPSSDAVDLGCGIGRFCVALAPRLRSIIGLDISARMVAEAQQRCAALPNVRIAQGSGRDLAPVAAGSCDLVLAADVFPYLVQAGGGLPEQHMREFARVLRNGGAALVLNYSYRGNPEADGQEVETLTSAAGLRLVYVGAADFTRWDAATFLIRK